MDSKKSLGAGIKIISIVILIGAIIGVLVASTSLMMNDSINKVLLESGQKDVAVLPTTVDYVISLVTSILIIIFVILILIKSKVGIFGYFTVAILNNVYNIILNEITTMTLISLGISIGILILYSYFIYKKRELYGFTKETIEVNN